MFCFISIETAKFLSIKLLIAMLRIQETENFDVKRLSNHTEIYGYEDRNLGRNKIVYIVLL